MKRRAIACLILLFVALAGCDFSVAIIGYSHLPDGGADAGAACTLVTRTPGWNGPYNVWTGQNDGQAPPCPGKPVTADEGWDWYADLVPPPACGPCTCAPSTGTCELSSTLTAHDVVCQDLGQNHKDISFDAAASWDGKCDTSTEVPGGVAKSVTIEPIAVMQESCKPLVPGPARSASLDARMVPQFAWKTLARACEGWNWIPQENPDTWCIPSDPPPLGGFKLCIMHEGEGADLPCEDSWPDRHVVYTGADDERECTKCTCGSPVGGMCTAMVSLDKDPACTAPVKQGIGISSAMPTCVDINPPGQHLVSKFVTSLTYLPGTCEPGPIDEKGTVTKTGAHTFCCRS